MNFVCFTAWADLPDSAQTLFKVGEKKSIFLTQPWFENLVLHAKKPEQSLLLACVVDSNNVLAIFPIYKHTSGNWSSLSHTYSSIFSILVDEDRQDDILHCLAQGLLTLKFISLRIEPTSKSDSNLLKLQEILQQNKVHCHHFFNSYNWVHRLNGQTFNDYLATRPKNVKNTIARKQRKLTREHGYNIRLYQKDKLGQAIADYNTVYQASWKASERYTHFTQGLVAKFAPRGCLRLAILYSTEQPIAAQIWFVVAAKASIYRLVYDEAWKPYSPGSILTQYLMQHVIDVDGVEEIDFLTGNEAYKQDWMSQRNERFGLVFTKQKTQLTRLDKFKKGVTQWFEKA